MRNIFLLKIGPLLRFPGDVWGLFRSTLRSIFNGSRTHNYIIHAGTDYWVPRGHDRETWLREVAAAQRATMTTIYGMEDSDTGDN